MDTTCASTTTAAGARHQRARRAGARPATAPRTSSGPRKWPDSSTKPRHDSSATQVVAARRASTAWRATPGWRGSAASPCRHRRPAPRHRAAAGAGALRASRGRARPTRTRAGRVGRAVRRASPAGSAAPAAPPVPAPPDDPGVDVEGDARAEPACAASGAAPGCRCGSTPPTTATISPPPPCSVSQPVSSCGAWVGASTASASSSGRGVEVGVAEVPRARRVLAGRGHQPDREAAVAQVHRDRGRDGHRRLERRGDALAAVGRAPGCPGTASPATATAAPRGGPSARRPGPSCASAPGAGRRRGGTRGPSRPRRCRSRTRAAGCRPDPVQAPPSGIEDSGTVRGVTVSGTVVWKARASSTSPNGSTTRTVIGPMSKRPRTSERTW